MALLTPDAVDVLSHSAVRARNCGVLMAACFDAEALTTVERLAGQQVDVSVLQVRSEFETSVPFRSVPFRAAPRRSSTHRSASP